MLRSFSISNFKNFKDRATFELANPANYAFNREVIKDGIVSKGIIYGENGSGKSNLALALFDVVVHVTDKERVLPKYTPYLNLDSQRSIAEFEYVFDFDGMSVIYRYGKTSVLDLAYESLVIGNEEVLNYDFARRAGFVRLEGAENLQLSSSLSADTDRISRVKYVRSNALLQDNKANRAFVSFVTFVDSMLMFYSLDERGYQGLSVGPGSFTEGIIRAGKMAEFQEFLAEEGLSYELVSVEENGRKELYCRYSNTVVPFMSVASTGTRSLALFYYWYIRMAEASFVFIDEFDAFYHFELSDSLVRRLKTLEGTQVFLTTHNTDLLSNDLLRPDAYFLVKGNKVTSLDKLSEKEIRFAHNMQKMFKAGSFDG